MGVPQPNDDIKNPEDVKEDPNLEVEPAFRQRYNTVMGEWQAGTLPYQETLTRLEALRQEALAAKNLVNLGGLANIVGIIHGSRGNYTESARYFETARQYHERAGSVRYVADCDLNLGETYRLQGNFNRAKMFFRRAYEKAKELNIVRAQAVALANEGQMWLSLKSLDKARQSLQEALTLVQEAYEPDENDYQAADRRATECEIRAALSHIAIEEKRYDLAWQDAKRAYEISQIDQQWQSIGQANRALANVISQTGKAPEEGFSDEADTYYKEALRAFREGNAEGEEGKTLYAQGMSMIKLEKKRAAARLFQQAMVIFSKLGMTDDAAKAAEAQMKVF